MIVGIILTLVALLMLFVKSAIYAVIFCFSTISFMTHSINPCYICPGLTVPVSIDDTCISGQPINMNVPFSKISMFAFLTNTIWFLLLTTCLCFTKYTRTFDTIFILVNVNALLSLATDIYGKYIHYPSLIFNVFDF